MTSRAAARLLEELARSPDGLPAYDAKGVREVLADMCRIAGDLRVLAPGGGGGDDDGDEGISLAPSITVHMATIARYRRCVLAYLMHRADRIELLRWTHGPVLGPELLAKLSSEEQDYFKDYSDLLVDFQEQERVGSLLVDFRPPKYDSVQVQALVDCGEMAVSKGGARRIQRDEICTLSRADAEPLIRKGMMKEVPRGC